jgi:hypothetical protein
MRNACACLQNANLLTTTGMLPPADFARLLPYEAVAGAQYVSFHPKGDVSMNRFSLRYVLLGLALTVALSAVAKPRSESITLYHDASLNGTNIPAGEYVVKYDVNGSDAKVTFMQGKKEVATANGQVKTLQKKSSSNQVVLNDQGRSISEIDFGGKDTAITFGSSDTAAGK